MSAIIEKILKRTDPVKAQIIKKKMFFAKHLYDLIVAKHLSQKAFAEQLDKHPSEISKWLSGTHNFTLDTIFEIEAKLDVKLVNVFEPKSKQKLITWTGTFNSSQNQLLAFRDNSRYSKMEPIRISSHGHELRKVI